MKQRVISAIVAALIVIPLLVIGGIPFIVGIALLAAIGLWEILRLKDKETPYPIIVKIISFICLELFVLNKFEGDFINTGINYLPVAISALALLIPSVFYKKEQYSTKDAFNLLGAVTLIGLFFNSLIVLYNTQIGIGPDAVKGIWLLLYLFIIAACTDTFAMLIGCLIGKHKLIPAVSPKKSVEGSIAGSFMGTAIGTLYYINIIGNLVLWKVIVMSLILTVFGQIGDLFFSKIKREHDIKDFSNIMPGHGGILDRLDSFSFILLGYIIIITIFNFIR
jgi:phosphatidate cytidylyltransferase